MKAASAGAASWIVSWKSRETLSVGGGTIKSLRSLLWHADNQCWTIAATRSNI